MSPNSETVVVGYDGSDTSKAAVHLAVRHVRGSGRVVIVHCQGDSDGVFELEPGLSELLAGTPCELLLSADAPARALVEVARDCNAMEIVVGARNYGLVRSGLGSVAVRVVHEADRPVTIVPPGFDPDYPEAA